MWSSVAALLSLSLAPAVGAVDPVVDLGYTSYRGVANEYNGVSHWQGMRFAAAPLGALRFQAPQDPIDQPGIQDASKVGKYCLATGAKPDDPETSEDCLFVDVSAPSNATNCSQLPVYFAIQGGGFNQNSNPGLNGTGLIQSSNYNMVTVTFNYRVGPWGFLAGSQVEKAGSVNNGIKDMYKALEWVKHHIAQFGGDPDHVVIGGDSAGAQAVTIMLTAYGGRDDGLFKAAISESQSFPAYRTSQECQYMYDNLAIRAGCSTAADSLACLRGLNASQIQAVNQNIPFPQGSAPPLYMFGPIIDNDIVPDLAYNLFQQGKFIKVPLLIGDDTNEGTIFAPRNASSYGDTSTFLRNNWPDFTLDQLRNISDLYPFNSSAPTYPKSKRYWRQASDAYGEIRYICPGIYISKVYAQYGLAGHTWNYRYNVEDPKSMANGKGVSHTSEMDALWWAPELWAGAPPSYNTTNAPIIPVVQHYWASFVTDLNPNSNRAPGAPEWSPWTSESSLYRLKIQTNATEMEPIPADQQARCEYLWSIAISLKQ